MDRNSPVGDLNFSAIDAISKDVEKHLLNKFAIRIRDTRFIFSTMRYELVVEFYFAVGEGCEEVDSYIQIMIGGAELRWMFTQIDLSASYMLLINYLNRRVSVELDKWAIESHKNCRRLGGVQG